MMRKPGILIFFIILLLALAGCLVYLAVTGPRLSTKAKFVDAGLGTHIEERGSRLDC